MTKAAYVGVLTEAPEYEETNATITSESDVGKYFTVEDSSYPFSWNTASTGLITYKSDSAANISGNRTYTSTWTAICDIDKLSFDWNSFAGGSASGSPYFEITVAGEQVVYRTMAGEGSWEGALSAGDEIVFTHYKQIYDTTYSYVTNVSLYCRTQTGTTIKGIARKIKKGYIGVGGIANRRLPEGYTQAEYVESDGASYFDTGFVPNQDTKVMMDALIPTEPSSIAVLFGARPNEGSSSDCVMVLRTASGVVRSYYDDSYKDMSGVDSLALLSVLKDKASTNVNGVTATHTYAEFSSAGSLFLSAMNAGGVATWHAALRIYSCSVYDNDKTVRFYVPCISPDGIVGLFDLVSMEFNAGVGSFTAGPAVSTEVYDEKGVARKVKKGYIGIGGKARPFFSVGELAYYGEVTAMSEKRRLLSASSVGGYALFAGGRDAGIYYNTVDAYDESLTRTTPTALSETAYSPAAATVGGHALFAGGTYVSSSNYMHRKTVNAYDGSLTKTSPADLGAARGSFAAATVGGHALFGGGISRVLASSVQATVYAYDESLTRTTPTALSASRAALAATTVRGHALFAGGATKLSSYGNVSISSSADVVDTVDAYDESLTRTTPTALSAKRGYISSTTVGGYALFGGGGDGSDSTVVDVYDESLTRMTAAALSVGGLTQSATTVEGYALFAGNGAKVDAYDESLTKSLPTALPKASYNGAFATVGNYAVYAVGATSTTGIVSDSAYAYTVV